VEQKRRLSYGLKRTDLEWKSRELTGMASVMASVSDSRSILTVPLREGNNYLMTINTYE